jgi:hypothetical protein
MAKSNPPTQQQLRGQQRLEVQQHVAARYEKDHASVRTIARELKRGYGSVHRLLTQSGVKMRARGGARTPRNHRQARQLAAGVEPCAITRTSGGYRCYTQPKFYIQPTPGGAKSRVYSCPAHLARTIASVPAETGKTGVLVRPSRRVGSP